ncbi:MAG: phosphoribosylamine--glycine ligase [Candidatus Diapherotrites archaeon]|nr:phosphoribosylamine--glycine ligase [Candidatus Diapherotrites archaeon]
MSAKQSILVVGSGAREHAIAWKLAQCTSIKKIYCAQGNAGISQQAECIDISAENIDALAEFAEREAIDLTVVGPEIPLSKGIVNHFRKQNLRIFGPEKAAAQIEGSKIFAKGLMQKYKIPTAECAVFDDAEDAKEYAAQQEMPIVVKADGLAAGKGVIICNNAQEAENAIDKIMVEKAFGDSGNKIIIEEFLQGEEASILAFSDGKNIIPMVPSQDHKRVYDNDLGANTGGMGAYAPAPIITQELQDEIAETILQPTIDAMRSEGTEYRGILYAGIMLCNNRPKVLEFNARFGDPETQAVLPLMRSDLLDAIDACIDGNLHSAGIKFSEGAACCVVLASGGYPEAYEKGKVISGLEAAQKIPDAAVFHAGTKFNEQNETITNGGRVLGVTGFGAGIKSAIDNAYAAVSKISFEKMHFRRDIGYRALQRL